jgi:hypothetical protein
MRNTITSIVAAAAIGLAPSIAFAGPHSPSPTAAPGQGQVKGQGYNHVQTQAQAKGQPNQSCETLGTTPGNSANAPGAGSPFSGEDSTAGTHYAGSQPQNSRNSASVSQYDVACANQPH